MGRTIGILWWRPHLWCHICQAPWVLGPCSLPNRGGWIEGETREMLSATTTRTFCLTYPVSGGSFHRSWKGFLSEILPLPTIVSELRIFSGKDRLLQEVYSGFRNCRKSSFPSWGKGKKLCVVQRLSKIFWHPKASPLWSSGSRIPKVWSPIYTRYWH